jgi:hypothetical protein
MACRGMTNAARSTTYLIGFGGYRRARSGESYARHRVKRRQRLRLAIEV